MGGKGGSTVQNYERDLSQQELDLLDTQNLMLQAGIGIAEEQEGRSADQFKQWQATYEPIETGLMPQGATRETGYYAPSGLYDPSRPEGTNTLFGQPTPATEPEKEIPTSPPSTGKGT